MSRIRRALGRFTQSSTGIYGDKMLNLTFLRGYVCKLLENTRIKRFLANRHAEMLAEFERIAATEGV